MGGGSIYLPLNTSVGELASRAIISGGSGPRKLGRFFSFALERVLEGGWAGARGNSAMVVAVLVFVTGNAYAVPSPKRTWCCLRFGQDCCGCCCVGNGLEDTAALASGAGMTSCFGNILLRDVATDVAFVDVVIKEEPEDCRVELLLAMEGWLSNT